MENIDVDGTPFSVLFDRAVKLKQIQTKSERIRYDSYPAFLANTITIYSNENDEVAAVRLLPTFTQRLEVANDMKQEGNTAFRDGRLEEALIKYESAIAIFRYLENTNDNWKKEGIKDEYIIEKEYKGNNEEESQQLNKLLVNCYNNIAIVSTKLQDFSLAIEACDYAIAVNEENDKAYYLRAQSRLAPMKSSTAEQVLAKSDLQTALQCNPNNKQARRQLERLNHQIKQQKIKDKRTFKGMFNRGEFYEELNNKGESDTQEQRDDKLIESKQRDIIMGRQLVQLYEERGMNNESKLEDSLKHEIEAMEQKEKTNNVDFHNPTEQMMKEAKSMGVDLNDSQTIELLEQMKNEHNSVGRASKNIQTSGLASQTRSSMLRRLIKTCFIVISGLIIGCALIIMYLQTSI